MGKNPESSSRMHWQDADVGRRRGTWQGAAALAAAAVDTARPLDQQSDTPLSTGPAES